MVPVMKGRKTTVHAKEVCLQRTGRMIDFYTLQFCIYNSHSELATFKKKKKSGSVSFYVTITEQ